MIVADASVVADFLLGPGTSAADDMGERLARREVIIAPHLLDAEVTQVIRRRTLRGETGDADARRMVADLVSLPIRRYAHRRIVHRAFELRENVTVYDALYLALAELGRCPLLTADAALAGVPGVDVEVVIVDASD